MTSRKIRVFHFDRDERRLDLVAVKTKRGEFSVGVKPRDLAVQAGFVTEDRVTREETLNGARIALFRNRNESNLNGLEFGLFGNSSGHVRGLQAGFSNEAERNDGLQLALVTNDAEEQRGIQVAIGGNYAEEARGWQGSFIFNGAREMIGVQTAAILNLTGDWAGWQAAGVSNFSGSVDGGQFSLLFNGAEGEVEGVQASFGFNGSSLPHDGIQAGLFNASGDDWGFFGGYRSRDGRLFGPYFRSKKSRD